jgi:outer membrane cobalamin receptor
MTLTRAMPYSGSSLTLTLLSVSSALDTNNVRLDDYTLLRLAMNQQLTPAITGTLRLDNITNTHYQQVRGFGTPGFALYGGLIALY